MGLIKYKNGEVYSINGVRVHPEANTVAMMTTEEQLALKTRIAEHGQEVPIILFRGFIVDGRCRSLACAELGIDVISISLPHKTTREQIKNKVINMETRRDKTTAQKAMRAAYALADDPKLRTGVATTTYASTPHEVAAAKYILANHPHVGKSLFDGERIQVGTHDSSDTPKYSVSVRVIAKYYQDNPYGYKKAVDSGIDTDGEFVPRTHLCSCGRVEPYKDADV